MGFAITQNGKVDSSTLGTRHKCSHCGTGWYDLHREDATCPGPSADVSCADASGPEEAPELEEDEETEEVPSKIFLANFKKNSEESEDDLFDDPEESEDEIPDDIEYIDIEDDD